MATAALASPRRDTKRTGEIAKATLRSAPAPERAIFKHRAKARLAHEIGRVANSWPARRVEALAYYLLVVWTVSLAFDVPIVPGGSGAQMAASTLAATFAATVTVVDTVGFVLRWAGRPGERQWRKWGCLGMAVFFGALAGASLWVAPGLRQGYGLVGLAVWCLLGYARLEMLQSGEATSH